MMTTFHKSDSIGLNKKSKKNLNIETPDILLAESNIKDSKNDSNNEIEKRDTTKLNNFLLPLNTTNNDPKKRGIEKLI